MTPALLRALARVGADLGWEGPDPVDTLLPRAEEYRLVGDLVPVGIVAGATERALPDLARAYHRVPRPDTQPLAEAIAVGATTRARLRRARSRMTRLEQERADLGRYARRRLSREERAAVDAERVRVRVEIAETRAEIARAEEAVVTQARLRRRLRAAYDRSREYWRRATFAGEWWRYDSDEDGWRRVGWRALGPAAERADLAWAIAVGTLMDAAEIRDYPLLLGGIALTLLDAPSE